MPSPRGQFEDVRCDLDPRPRGAPMLSGDLSRLAGARPTADLRQSPGPPATPRQRRLKRKYLIILLCRVNGLPLSVIADAFGLTPARISMICTEMGYGDL